MDVWSSRPEFPRAGSEMVARAIARQAGQWLSMPPSLAPARDVRDYSLVHFSSRPFKVGCAAPSSLNGVPIEQGGAARVG